jgi:hypothetical protein
MSSVGGSLPGQATASTPRPTVVLACSGPEAGAIVEVARALIPDGVRVDVVAGVDLDSRPIELALEQHAPNTLWVMCRSEQLDEYQLELLLLTVRASEVPEDHVIALPYDADAISTFVGLVRRRLAQLGWLAGEPGVPAARPADVTPVPSLTPEASDLFDDAPARRSPGGVLAAALAVCACVGLGAWWWTGSGAQASESPIAHAPSTSSEAEPSPPTEPRVGTPRTQTTEAAPERPAAPVAPEVSDEPTRAEAPRFDPVGPIGIALAERRIRALDALLVATPGARVTARRARKQCGKLEIAGVRGWRLPQADELDALAEAGFLPDDAQYWARRGKSARRARISGERVLTRAVGRKVEAALLCVADPKA